MLFLLDTNAFSDLMLEHPKIQARLGSLGPPDEVAICTIVRGEILQGINGLQPGRKRGDFEQKSQRLFRTIACRSILPSAGDHYAVVKLACKRKGVARNENDFWIAATALSLNATVVTRDSDFSRIDNLPVQDWTT